MVKREQMTSCEEIERQREEEKANKREKGKKSTDHAAPVEVKLPSK